MSNINNNNNTESGIAVKASQSSSDDDDELKRDYTIPALHQYQHQKNQQQRLQHKQQQQQHRPQHEHLRRRPQQQQHQQQQQHRRPLHSVPALSTEPPPPIYATRQTSQQQQHHDDDGSGSDGDHDDCVNDNDNDNEDDNATSTNASNPFFLSEPSVSTTDGDSSAAGRIRAPHRLMPRPLIMMPPDPVFTSPATHTRGSATRGSSDEVELEKEQGKEDIHHVGLGTAATMRGRSAPNAIIPDEESMELSQRELAASSSTTPPLRSVEGVAATTQRPHDEDQDATELDASAMTTSPSNTPASLRDSLLMVQSTSFSPKQPAPMLLPPPPPPPPSAQQQNHSYNHQYHHHYSQQSPASPGNTSLSSWDSPAVSSAQKKQVLLQFAMPERRHYPRHYNYQPLPMEPQASVAVEKLEPQSVAAAPKEILDSRPASVVSDASAPVAAVVTAIKNSVNVGLDGKQSADAARSGGALMATVAKKRTTHPGPLGVATTTTAHGPARVGTTKREREQQQQSRASITNNIASATDRATGKIVARKKRIATATAAAATTTTTTESAPNQKGIVTTTTTDVTTIPSTKDLHDDCNDPIENDPSQFDVIGCVSSLTNDSNGAFITATTNDDNVEWTLSDSDHASTKRLSHPRTAHSNPRKQDSNEDDDDDDDDNKNKNDSQGNDPDDDNDDDPDNDDDNNDDDDKDDDDDLLDVSSSHAEDHAEDMETVHHSADDEKTVDRPPRLKNRCMLLLRSGHRRTRSGDGAAAILVTGGKDWKGMDKDQIPLPEAVDDDEDDDNDDDELNHATSNPSSEEEKGYRGKGGRFLEAKHDKNIHVSNIIDGPAKPRSHPNPRRGWANMDKKRPEKVISRQSAQQQQQEQQSEQEQQHVVQKHQQQQQQQQKQEIQKDQSESHSQTAEFLPILATRGDRATPEDNVLLLESINSWATAKSGGAYGSLPSEQDVQEHLYRSFLDQTARVNQISQNSQGRMLQNSGGESVPSDSNEIGTGVQDSMDSSYDEGEGSDSYSDSDGALHDDVVPESHMDMEAMSMYHLHTSNSREFVEPNSSVRGSQRAQPLSDSPFANFGRKSPDKAQRSVFAPESSVLEHESESYPTFVCPVCNTRQRMFFSVEDAPRQMEGASGYLPVYFALYVVCSLCVFGLKEGWMPLDCIYFAVITLTTCGLGDFVPTTDGSKIICSFFIYFGVACIGLLLGSYIAGMLDDRAVMDRKAKLMDSCPTCARIKIWKETAVKRAKERSSRKWRGRPSLANAPRYMSERFSNEPLHHAAVHSSAHLPSVKETFNESTSEERQRATVEVPSQSGTLSISSAIPIPTRGKESAGLVPNQDPGDAAYSPPLKFSPILRSPAQNFLGSPVTRQILGRQSHTRHSSIDISNMGAIPMFKSRDMLSSMMNNVPTISEGIPAEHPSSAPQMRSFDQTEQEDTNSEEEDESSVTSDTSARSTKIIDDTSRKIRAAKYVLLTLRQALVNSMVIIAVGCVGFCWIEGFSLVDSWYFTTVLLTSVGYGDITPTTNGGKLFATIYILVAGTLLLNNMSLISMIPLELRKRRIERAVLMQFGDQLDDAALRELATGPVIQRLNLSTKRPDGLDECTREMFALAMLVRLGKVNEDDIRETFAAFQRLDVNNEGVLNSKSIIAGMILKRRALNSLHHHQQPPSQPPPPPPQALQQPYLASPYNPESRLYNMSNGDDDIYFDDGRSPCWEHPDMFNPSPMFAPPPPPGMLTHPAPFMNERTALLMHQANVSASFRGLPSSLNSPYTPRLRRGQAAESPF